MEVNTDEAKLKIENLGDCGYLRPVNQGALLYSSGTLTDNFILFKPILTMCLHTYNQGFSSPPPLSYSLDDRTRQPDIAFVLSPVV